MTTLAALIAKRLLSMFIKISGKITLDKIFQERTSLNSNIVSEYIRCDCGGVTYLMLLLPFIDI